MATPHVAGAAALLLQAVPGIGAAEAKAALTSTADPADAVSVYGQGAGRVDVAHAVRAAAGGLVVAGGSLSFGHFAYPHTGRPPRGARSRSATAARRRSWSSWRRASRRARRRPAAGVLSLPPRVTVPAGGTADVAVELDTTRAAPGLYGGRCSRAGRPARSCASPWGSTSKGRCTTCTSAGSPATAAPRSAGSPSSTSRAGRTCGGTSPAPTARARATSRTWRPACACRRAPTRSPAS